MEELTVSAKVIDMNDAVRAAINARLRERGMSRADLARAVDKTPQEISRALNDTGGRGGSVPPLWAAMLDALGLTLAAVPVEYVSGSPLALPSDPQALEREISERVTRAVREALTAAQHLAAQPSTAPDSEPGSAGGDDSTP